MKNSDWLVMAKLFFLLAVFFMVVLPASAASHYVGSGETYTTIQAAVDGAYSGDTIIVKDGTYNENVEVDKPLTIQSENGNVNALVLAANPADNVFSVTAANVTINGFTVYGANAFGKAGIMLTNIDNCTVSNNRCGYEVGKENYYGVVFSQTTNCTANNNVCSANYHTGMIVDADDSQVSENECELNTFSGISVSGQRNRIENNTCTCSEHGCGIKLLGSNSIVKGNDCSENSFQGIYCLGIENYTICYNSCKSNMNDGIYLEQADNNLIILNDFDSNFNNVYSFNNSWEKYNSWETPVKIWYGYDRYGTLDPPYSRSHMGNYYSDHGSSDADEDGICDTAYDLPGTEPNDVFPLFETTVNYGWDIDCYWDAEVESGEDLLVLGDLTIGSNGTGSLTIAGSLTLGSI